MGEGERGHPPGVPSPGSGRKPKTFYSEEAKQQLHEGVLDAVAYLRDVVQGKKKSSPGRVEAAKEHIHQCIGKPTQRIEAEGSVSPELMELLGELKEIKKGDGTNGGS